MTQFKIYLMPRKWLIASSFVLISILCFYACQKDEPNSKSSLNTEKVKSDALKMSTIHDSAISHMYNYPDYSYLNSSQRVKVANSYLWIHGHDHYDSIKYRSNLKMINDFLFTTNLRDVNSVINYLKRKTSLSENALNYIKHSYSVLSMNSPLENKVSLLENYLDELLENEKLTDIEKVNLANYFAIVKGSAANWKRLVEPSSNALGKNNACNDCLSNNWGWFAAADGLGGIIVGIFSGGAGALNGALTASAATVATLCPECYEAADELYDYAPCPNCPSPYVYDGVNCWLFTPPSGSNPYIANGNFYWDDPTHTCNPPGSPAYWDGVHCVMQYQFPSPEKYFGFKYNGGFYIKCAN